MVAPIGINTSSVTQRSFETNMQQVGGQRQAVRTQDNETSSSQVSSAHSFDNIQLSDSVSFAQDASENAAHVGVAQDEFDQGQDVSAEEFGVRDSGPQILGQDGEMAGEAGVSATPDGCVVDENGFILADGSTPNVGGEVPPTDGQVPPAEGGEVPPAEGGEIPPEDGGAVPPADGGDVPPTDGSDVPPEGPGDVPPEHGAGASEETATQRAERLQKEEADYRDAMQIMTQMQADRAKWFAELWKIIQDTQTSIFSIIQDVIGNKAQTYSRCHDNWTRTFRGH